MINGEYTLNKSNGATFDEKIILGQSNALLGFDSSLNPTMKLIGTISGTLAAGDDSRFHVATSVDAVNGLGIIGQQVTLQLASTSTHGALSDTDWNTFNGKQVAYSNLTSIGSLANATGWLKNNGSGTFSYSTPNSSDIGLGNVTNNAQWYSGNHPTTVSGYGITDAALASHTHTLLTALPIYVWNAADLPNAYSLGIQSSFVSATEGFPSFGSLMTMKTYSGGGGSLQMYVPYSSTMGGNTLKVRFGDYSINTGNSWTDWKALWHDGNFNPANYSLTSHNHSGVYLTSFTETDPTVPAWAKQASKPSYAWSEIGGTVPTWNQNTTGNSATTSRLRQQSSNIADANLLTGGGAIWYYGQSGGFANIPGGFNSYGSVFQFNSANAETLALQFANDINNNSVNATRNLWFRSSNNLGWQNDWKALWHSGNFNPANYSLSSHNHAGVYEPAFTKNTGFNKDFGTTSGTVLEGRTFGSMANASTGDYLPLSAGSVNALTGTLYGTVANFSSTITGTDITGTGDFWVKTSNGLAGRMYFGNALDARINYDGTSFSINKPTTFGSSVTATQFNRSDGSTMWHSGNLTNTLTANYLPKWNGSSLVNGLISDDGSISNTNNHFRLNINDASVSASNYTALRFCEFGTENGRISMPRDGLGVLRIDVGINYSRFGVYSNGVKGLFQDELGRVSVNTTTASTSPTTGALVVVGGIGVGGDSWFNGLVNINDINYPTLALYVKGAVKGGFQYFNGGMNIYSNGVDYRFFVKDDGFTGIGYGADPTSSNKLAVNGNAYVGGNITATGLSGTGTRMVVANASGTLSTQDIPTFNEPFLGYPSTDGYVLSSTVEGVRSWIPNGSGSSQFTNISGGMYYNAGRVAIGSTSPDFTNSQPNGFVIGGNTITGTNSKLTLADSYSIAANGRGFRDQTQIDATGTISYANFDAEAKINGTQSYGHIIGFQARHRVNSSGTLTNWIGAGSVPTQDQGTVTNVYDFAAYPGYVYGGSRTNRYCFYVDNGALQSGNPFVGGSSVTYGVYITPNIPSWFGGDISCNALTQRSDIRLKTNFKNISIDTTNINYYQFNMLDNLDQLRYGAKAQEIEKILPNVVRTNEKGYKDIAYIDLFVIEISNLKQQNKLLNERLKKLENL